MQDFYRKLADILEIAELKPTDALQDFPEWDSLTVLSVIAMIDADYGENLSAQDLWNIRTAQELWELVGQRTGKAL